MFFTDSSCSYCNISTKNSYRAFFIRLSPGNEYLIICDCCLARERRYLQTEDPALESTCSSTALGEQSVRWSTASTRKTTLEATRRLIKNLFLPKIHDRPIISTLFRSHKRFS